jgi:nucleotide sugar dehydrogenase
MNSIPSCFEDRTICIMGLGYVGLTLAVVMADVGFDVIGVEIRDDVLKCLERGEPHFHEPGLKSRLKRVIGTGRLTLHSHIPETCTANAFIVTVGTPLDAGKRVRTDMIKSVTEEIAGHVKEGALIIMRSTVRLGTTRSVVKPVLDRTGKRYDLVFCPERTLEGRAIAELRELPQIVAGQDHAARMRAARLFQFLTPTVVQVSDLETAELIKLVDNAQRDLQFAVANEVARIADAIGVSATEVIKAGKFGYARTNLPMPGPVGGPCLEKDTYILAEGLASYGLSPALFTTARRLNETQPGEVIGKLAAHCRDTASFPAAPVITLAGLAFKGRPETDDLRGTMARPILAELRRQFPKAAIRGFDAVLAPETARKFFDFDVVGDLESAFAGASLVVVANNHPIFESMAISYLAESMRRPGVIFDFWNNFSARETDLPPGVAYTGLGDLGRHIRSVVGDGA